MVGTTNRRTWLQGVWKASACLTLVAALGLVAGCDPCQNVVCDEGLICDPGPGSGAGDCVECLDASNCFDGQECVDRACVTPDPCADVTCEDGQECVDGECQDVDIDPCDDVTCDGGQECVNGECAAIDLCADVTCADGEICDAETGECAADLCADVTCEDDGVFCNGTEACDAATGDCASSGDPCDTAGGETCNEETDACDPPIACTEAAECDDGLFCNGEESCTDGVCVSAGTPCAEGETCNDDTDECEAVSVPGEQFALSTGLDQLTGTPDDDTFTGVLVSGNNSTLTAGDSIDGAGGNDRFDVIIDGADFAPIATFTNLEELFIRNVTDARTFNALGILGLNTVWSDRSLATLTISNLDEIVNVGVLNSDQDFLVTFTNSALTGTDDAVTIELSQAKKGCSLTVQSTGAVGDAGIETFVINSVGTAANEIDSITDGDDGDVKTLNITGTMDLKISAVDSNIKTIDASATAGKVDVSIAGLSGLTFTGSPQDDMIRASTTSATDKIDGGDGIDLLEVSGTLTTGTTLTNVESLTLKPSAAMVVFDLEKAQTISSVQIEPTVAITDIKGTKLPAVTTLTVKSDNAMALDSTANSAYTLNEPTGSADTLNFVFQGNGTLGVGGTNGPNFTGFEKVSFALNAGAVTFSTGVLDAGNTMTHVIMSGNRDVAVAGLISSSTAFTNFDASALTGALTLVTGNFPGTTMTIKGGSGNDVIFSNAGTDIIDGGAGNDLITGAAGADTITTGTGLDTVSTESGASATIDTVTDFDEGTAVTTVDKILIDLSDAEAPGTVTDLISANLTSVAAAATVYAALASDGAAPGDVDVVGIIGDYADAAAALAARTSWTIALGGAATDNDAILIAYKSGSDVRIAIAVIAGTGSDTDGVDEVIDILILQGVTLGNITSADFAAIQA